MEIKVAKSAGFCFGVQRAVDALLNKKDDENISTLGPIIHNEAVVELLKTKGVDIINVPSDAKEGTKIAIRTHGVCEKTYEEIKKNGEFIDLTCPFVKKIHNIVNEHYKKGYKIIIAGDKGHPEVDGINGWCENSADIIISEKELENKHYDKVCLVAQTTLDSETYKKIKKFLKKSCQNVLIFDTICSATEKRQKEADSLSKISDAMIVIGGKHSANTTRLTSICAKSCANTYQIENFEEIPQILYAPTNNIIGITAGASTPPWIIKEVIGTMEEMIKDGNEISFAEALEAHEKAQALVALKTGDIVKGTVMRVENNGVSVNLGYKSDGFIPAGEVIDDPNADISSIINVGDEIEVFVVRVNDVEGEVTLSKRKIDAIKSEKVLEEACENGTVLEGTVVEVVSGGLVVSAQGGRVFVPASLASDRRMADLSNMKGEKVSFIIKEITKKRGRNKVIGSIRAVMEQQKRALSEAFWAEVEVGKVYNGTVKSLTKFGAFVDIGGVDGLVHISELSWAKIKHPSEVVKEGDVVEVKVLELNKETGKISLGYKKTEDNPWEKAKAELEVGKDIACKVVRIVPFGAFAEIYPGVDGLIHISQVANKRIGKVEDELTIGQHITARVVDLDLENNKIGLSIRAILAENEPEEVKEEAVEETTEEVTAETTEEVVETAETTEE